MYSLLRILMIASIFSQLTVQNLIAQPVVSSGAVPAAQNPSGPVLAARWRSLNNNAAQRAIYVGWGDIGISGNRQQTSPNYTSSNTITLVYNAAASTLTATYGPSTVTFSNLSSIASISANLCRLNYLTFSIRNNVGNNAAISLNNLTLNSQNLSNFSLPQNASNTNPFWTIDNFDFSQNWTLSATLVIGSGNIANAESGRIEVSVGVRNPVTATSVSSFCAGSNSTVSFTGLIPNSNYTMNYNIAGVGATSPSFATDASGNGSFSLGPLSASNYNQTFTATSFLRSGGCAHPASVLNSATLLEASGCSSLPVTFGQVDARKVGADVNIKWSTATEVNNSHFLVERSTDGVQWVGIGRVAGHGNSSVTRNYSFTDRRAGSGRIIYRIRQVDFDGQFSFSKTVVVDLRSNVSVRMSPIPMREQLNIEASISSPLKEVWVIGLNGEIKFHDTQPGQKLQLNTTSWKAGAYIVRMLFADGQTHVQRIIRL